MTKNNEYMNRAIELAKKGLGHVNPNPMVGAVIVKEGRIIGEGYHAKYGELHAERNAFANLSEPADGASIYVTLEPCCHYGKQPPCTEVIVQNQISEVYIGSFDPNPQVSGKGIEYLRSKGIKVYTDILKNECYEINSVFFHYIANKTPYVVLKYAMTMDGKIASFSGKSKWITNEKSRRNVQLTRKWLKGIMVGVGTVIADDPMLTCRIEDGVNPIRIICDTNLRIPLESKIVNSAKEISTIIVVGKNKETDPSAVGETNRASEANRASETNIIDKINKIKEMNIEVIEVDTINNQIDLKKLMIILGQKGIDGILLEGGGTLNYSAVKSDIVNEVQVYIAPKILGGSKALAPVEGVGFENPDIASGFKLKSIREIDGDILAIYNK